MQTIYQRLSQLKNQLIYRHHTSMDELALFLSNRPLMKGTLYPLRRKCSKPSCRCARGKLHETMVLTANLGGKTRLWMIPEDRIEAIRQQTEQYRQFRKARSAFIKKSIQRKNQILQLIDAIGTIRIRQP